MDRRILVWLIILAILAMILGYLMTGNKTTTTTTTLQEIASTTFSPTTTRAITRPTQPTTTKVGATTLQATTTTLSGASTTLPSSSNATTSSSTTTTRTGHTNPQTTTTSTTISGATTNPTTTTTVPGATTSTTTQSGVTTTTLSGTTTTTTFGATTTTTTSSTTPQSTTTSSTTRTTITTTSTTTRTTTTTTRTTTTTTTTRTTMTTTTSTTSTTQPALSGPVVYLKFDESAGSTAYDSSSGSNDGSLISGPLWASGRSGNALRFDGTNDYVDVGNAASLDITGPITIMAWVNPSIAQELCYPSVGCSRGIASKVEATDGVGDMDWSWQLRYGSPTGCALGFQFNDPVNGDRWVSVGQALTPGQWYHVTATFDGSTLRSYLNGALKQSTTMSSIKSYPSTKLLIASDGWSDYFSGSVDDFRIYKRALSATEINQIISAVPSTTTPTTTATTKATTTPTTTATTRATTNPTSATTKSTTTPTTTATTRATTTPTTTATTKATTPTTIPTGAVYAANYGVGSGLADETQNNLNAIAAAAASSSKTLIYPAGKTTIITGFIRFPDGLTVVGNGCTIKRGNIGSHGGQMISLGSGGSGAEVYGLIYDGNSFGVHSAGDGILLNSNSYFHDNEVKNVREYSVNVYGGSNIRISNNIIHDGLQYGICTGGGDEGGRSHNIVVTGNTIYNMMEVGIKMRGTTGATIRGNTVTMGDSPQSGGDTSSHHTTVRGISLYSDDCTNDNILIDGNTVTGQYEGYDGDAISSDPPSNTNIRITNNKLSKCSIGIDVRFTGGTITGNTIFDCSTCISGGSGNTLSGNTCT